MRVGFELVLVRLRDSEAVKQHHRLTNDKAQAQEDNHAENGRRARDEDAHHSAGLVVYGQSLRGQVEVLQEKLLNVSAIAARTAA